MPHQSRKDTLAICGRSGIETLKSNLVRDGYMRGLWVLPEYYEPPQPIKYRPKPEIPPYNPQPLIDIYPQTVTLNGGMDLTVDTQGIPPFSLTNVGKFLFSFNITSLLTPLQVVTTVGEFGFEGSIELNLIGVESVIELYSFSRVPFSGYGSDAYGEGDYNGTTPEVAAFRIALHMGSGVLSITSTGNLLPDSGYGSGSYGEGPYGGFSEGFGTNSYGEFGYGGII